MNFNIIDFESVYRDSVRILNEAWLKKYFVIEPRDVIQLADPEGEILSKGGYICFAKTDDDKVVGVAALMVVADAVCELSKMAVDEEAQGYGIGRALAEHCLKKAESMCCRSVILYTNTRLETAVALYRKLGFYEIELEQGTYGRANLKMELNLLAEKHRSLGFMKTRFWY